MNCHEAKRLITPYLEGTISERVMPDFVDHVKNCPSCFDELEIYSTIHYTLNDTGDSIDINEKSIRHELDRRLQTLMLNRSRRRQFLLVVIAAQICLLISVAVSLFPQDYKDLLESILEFFWW